MDEIEIEIEYEQFLEVWHGATVDGRTRADLERAARAHNNPTTGDFGVRILNVYQHGENLGPARLALVNDQWKLVRLTRDPHLPLEIP